MFSTEIDAHDLFRLVLLLDAALPALDKAAAAEKRREAHKSLRETTEQHRAESARKLVAKMVSKYGIDLD